MRLSRPLGILPASLHSKPVPVETISTKNLRSPKGFRIIPYSDCPDSASLSPSSAAFFFLVFGGKEKLCKDPSCTFCLWGCCCLWGLSVTKVRPVISHYPGAVFDYPKIRKKGDIFYDETSYQENIPENSYTRLPLSTLVKEPFTTTAVHPLYK